MLDDLSTRTCKIIPFGDHTGSPIQTKIENLLNIYPNTILEAMDQYLDTSQKIGYNFLNF